MCGGEKAPGVVLSNDGEKFGFAKCEFIFCSFVCCFCFFVSECLGVLKCGSPKLIDVPCVIMPSLYGIPSRNDVLGDGGHVELVHQFLCRLHGMQLRL